MGLFDTIILDPPLKCESCGEDINSMQTKNFEKLMQTITIGDLVESRTIHGIIKDNLICMEHENEEGHHDWYDVYLVIWNQILIGAEFELTTAQALLDGFSMHELRGLLVKNYEEKEKFHARYRALKKSIRGLWKYHSMTEEEREHERNKKFGFLLFSEEEEFKAEDPIDTIIEKIEEGVHGHHLFL